MNSNVYPDVQLVRSTLYTKQGLLHTPSTVHLAAYTVSAMAQVVMDVVLRLIEIPQKNLLFYSIP